MDAYEKFDQKEGGFLSDHRTYIAGSDLKRLKEKTFENMKLKKADAVKYGIQ